jgi:hypothetical protein
VLNACEGLTGACSKHQQRAAPALAPQVKLALQFGQMLPPAGAACGVSVTRVIVLSHRLAQQNHLPAEIAASRAHTQVRPQAHAFTKAQAAILGFGERATGLLAV